MVLLGIAWYCMVLHGIAWYCMVLHGIAWYCMVLHVYCSSGSESVIEDRCDLKKWVGAAVSLVGWDGHKSS